MGHRGKARLELKDLGTEEQAKGPRVRPKGKLRGWLRQTKMGLRLEAGRGAENQAWSPSVGRGAERQRGSPRD